MKLTLATILMLLSVITLQAQRKIINVDNFTDLSFGVPGTLYVTQGTSNKVEVEASNEDMDRIEFVVDGNRLKIRNRRSISWKDWNNSKITVYVTMKKIDGLSVSGSGKLIGKTMLETGSIDLDVSGSGSIDIDLSAGDVDLDISGSGTVSLKGSGDNADFSISGSGKVKGEEFAVNVCDLDISGSGSVYITANKEIDARISGSGSVFYSGNPDKVSSHSSGSGKVRKL